MVSVIRIFIFVIQLKSFYVIMYENFKATLAYVDFDGVTAQPVLNTLSEFLIILVT